MMKRPVIKSDLVEWVQFYARTAEVLDYAYNGTDGVADALCMSRCPGTLDGKEYCVVTNDGNARYMTARTAANYIRKHIEQFEQRTPLN